MSLNTFDKGLSQYERKMARQRKLEAMEAAATGRPSSNTLGGDDAQPVGGSSNPIQSDQPPAANIAPQPTRRESTGGESEDTRRSGTHAPPEGAIESARRFLWDEDEEDYSIPSRMFIAAAGEPLVKNDPPAQQPMDRKGKLFQERNTLSLRDVALGNTPSSSGTKPAAGFMKSMRGIVSKLPPIFSGTGTQSEKEDLSRNIAPHRDSVYMDSNKSDRYMEDSDLKMAGSKDNRQTTHLQDLMAGCVAYITMGCAAFSQFIGDMCRGIGRCCESIGRNKRALFLALLLLAVISLLTYEGITNGFGNNSSKGETGAEASTAKKTSKGKGKSPSSAPGERPSAPNTPDSVEKSDRYQFIRKSIIDAGLSYQTHIDTRGTAPNLALRWIAEGDMARMETNDDMILQRYALATFFFSTYVASEYDDAHVEARENAGWRHPENWMTEKGICDWWGVKCAPRLHKGKQETHYNDDAPVIELNMTDNNIRGTIPREVAAFENLVTLDLGRNKFYGSIPAELGKLKDLVNLYLQENIFSGTIPGEIKFMTKLRNLHLGSNSLDGTLPKALGSLTELRAFGVDGNKLVGSIPPEMGGLLHLMDLYLDDNYLTGSIPTSFGKLGNLVDFRLRKNELIGNIPSELAGMKRVELFYLDDNFFNGTIPDMFSSMPRLQEIQLYKNYLKGPLPESIGSLKDLHLLYMDSNELTGSLPASYGSLDNLNTFFLYNNFISGTIPTTFGQLKNLKDWRAYENDLVGKLPTELKNCHKLEILYLEDNLMYGGIPSELGQLKALRGLRLNYNQFTGVVPADVCNLKEEDGALQFISTDCGGSAPSVTCSCCDKCYEPRGTNEGSRR